MKSPWHTHEQRGRRFVFWGFAGLFGGLALLFIFGLAAILLLPYSPPNHDMHRPPAEMFPWLCAVPLVIVLFSFFLGGLGFRRFGLPLANIMSAVDSVGRGDFSVRLKERGPGQVWALAHSFNQMVAELQRAEQQRRSLTADIAHELRTPLHIIQGNLEGMLDGVYEPNRENLLSTLDETHLLARLVSDLQTLSLAETGQLPLHLGRFLASDLLADVTTSFSAQAAAQGVTIQIQPAQEAPSLELLADYDRLDQVLSNLVSNALRHTSSGGEISLGAQPIFGLVRLTVTDTGSGIPAEDLPFIFDRFWKADRARTRGGGAGSGLGLAIARQLIRAHGGDIRAESVPGQGATFIIELPSAPAQGEPAK